MGLPWEHRQRGETEASGGDFVTKVVHLLEASAKMYIYRILFGVDEHLKKNPFAVPL